ncbi:MAG TPA: magnesium-translocating P-type ATPase [Gemmatimonadaceae bacterium]|nr:magnesium-translocating P-type ATPase [Gemmatimonadaceae bacterium]
MVPLSVAAAAPAAEAAPASAPGSQGLSTTDAARMLALVGPNDIVTQRRGWLLREIAAPFASPLVLTLLVASVISAFVGEVASAAIIALMVLLSAAMYITQTYRSHRAMDALRASMAPTATVLRDGQWGELERRLLVPGDLIRLSAGDLVPADARVLDARDLHVQQASLTGEPLPVEKSPGAFGDTAPDSVDDAHLVFLGTSVTSGTGTALVMATGATTRYGESARHLAMRQPETEFERGMRTFSLFITRVVVSLVLFVAAVSITLHRDPLESLLFAVALAVGLVPEFLPMITSVTLASGAVRMSRRKVIVKHLQAIQNLGSMDVLCSDKTGTLTSGEMEVVNVVAAGGGKPERVLALARVNSRFETGITSPLDKAILRCAPKGPDSHQLDRKLDEIPFDFERRLLSVVVTHDDTPLLIAKGAPESVFARCDTYEDGDEILPLDSEARARLDGVLDRASALGQRVLAVAVREVAPKPSYTAADEAALTLTGLVAFSDPPLADTRATVAALHDDGVRVKILTGDDERTAAYVCSSAGLLVDSVVVGSQLDRLTDAALAPVAERTTLFARVSPAQKNRILLALKARGHVVGFMGDGVNDAPALHTADVGISVAGATDIAREAADVVLLERNLGVLHSGIVEGRRAFGNVLKYLLMGTSSSFGNMFSMAGAAVVLPFLPMLPMQILLANFLCDVAQLTIPTDRVDESWIRSPRKWDVRFVRNFMFSVGPVSSIFDVLTFYALLRLFHASEPLFHTGWFVESLVTQVLVLLVIRTMRSPLRDPPSRALAVSITLVVAFGMLLPYLPLAGLLGFTPLPASFFALLIALTLTYLLIVERVKVRVARRWLPLSPTDFQTSSDRHRGR